MYVKSIRLENMKGFKELQLDFERPDHTFRGWTVLVGGNDSGKSTLLKALALCMLGPDAGRQLLVSPAGWISPKAARAEARLKMHLDKSVDFFKGGGAPPAGEFEAGLHWSFDQKEHGGNREPVTPEFRAIEFRNAKKGRIQTAERGPWNPNAAGWFCAGYGPMRRLSGSSSESMRFSVAGGTMSRSIYATVLDLIHNMAEVYGSAGLFAKDAAGHVVVQKPGVVLIDEIEAHLHPKWQLDIPEWLKIHFPKVQFIVSTHSPLVAQAADPNGVFVLPSQDEAGRIPRRLDEHEYERLRLGRAEKTLLGTALGLKSTRSKWANDRIVEWKRLNAKARSGTSLSPVERTDFSELQEQMHIAFDEFADNVSAESPA